MDRLASWRQSLLVRHLAAAMPAGLMLVLVAYLLRDVPGDRLTTASTELAALALVIALQWRRGNARLSIFAGTAAYVVPINLLAQ